MARHLVLLVGACLLAPAALALEEFRDDDFKFTLTLPDGLRRVEGEELQFLLGQSAGDLRNIPRAEAAGAQLTHTYLWLDTGSAHRQVHLVLVDRLPYESPDDFVKQLESGGNKTENKKPIGPPVGPALRADTRFSPEDGQPVRRINVLALDPGTGRGAVLSLQGLVSEWDVLAPAYEAAVETLRLERSQKAGGAPAAGPGGPRAGRPIDAAGAPVRRLDPGDWGSLEVVGSLILAALLVLAFVFLRGDGVRPAGPASG